MMILLFIRNIYNNFKRSIISSILLTKLQKKYPTCRFYSGSCIDNKSKLSDYNVIFNNVIINNSIVGDHTFVQKDSVINHADIGKFCSIASRVCIGLGQHPTDYISTHPAFYSSTQPLVKTFSQSDIFSPFKRVKIGHDVWIGINAMIMDGVNIGTGAVIGAGAVVTKDIPEYAIAGGTPAKIIRYRFKKDIRKKLIKAKWWDRPEEWLQKHYKLFCNPRKFLKYL